MLKHSPEYYADKYRHSFMQMAYAVAENSVAVRRKVGCVIYLNNHTLSLGWNGRESGSDSEECEYKDYMTVDDAMREPIEYIETQWPLFDDEGSYGLVSYSETLHSEFNAISKLPEGSELLKGAILFVSTQPCKDCSGLIFKAGITKVYYKEPYRCDKGLTLLREANIVVEQID